jgi:hypothetical protein
VLILIAARHGHAHQNAAEARPIYLLATFAATSRLPADFDAG